MELRELVCIVCHRGVVLTPEQAEVLQTLGEAGVRFVHTDCRDRVRKAKEN